MPEPLVTAGLLDTAGLFGQRELAPMAIAFRTALMIASDDDGPFSDVPARDLRGRLARAIVEEARNGNLDADLLRARALEAVRDAWGVRTRDDEGGRAIAPR